MDSPVWTLDDSQVAQLHRQLCEVLKSTSLDAVLVADVESGHLIDANERAAKLFGRSVEELVGMHQRDLHPVEKVASYERIFRLQARRRHGVMPAVDIQCADGTVIPVEVETETFSLGDRVLMVGVFRDVRPTLEERVARVRAETRLRSLVEESQTGVYIIRQGRFAYVNPRMAELFGRSRESLYGLDSILEVVHPDDRETVRSNIARRVRGEVSTLQYRFRGLRGLPRDDGGFDPENVFDVEVRGTRSDPEEHGEVEVVGMLEDITDRLRAERDLERLARYDDLTGLFNRAEMQRLLDHRIGATATGDALVLVDVDQFTSVNEAFSDAAGDHLLRQMANLLTNLNLALAVSRWGDDEFALLLPEAGVEGALRDAERVRLAIRNHQTEWDGHPIRVTASLAVVPLDEDVGTLSHLMQSVHATLRSARELGGDRIELYQPREAELETRRTEASWRLRIRDALEDDAFTLYAQPIVPLLGPESAVEQGSAVAEVLLRLPGGREPVPAGRFIPVAERHGLIQRIDRWVLAQVVRTLAAVRRAGPTPDLELMVNLSPRSIESPDFRSWLLAHVHEARDVAHAIRFEITETTAVRDLEAVRDFAEKLGRLGCGFVLDDFGSGANSVAYLTLPVTALKIDGVLVRRLPVSDQQRAVVRAYVEIAQKMGLRTIAEGVQDAMLYSHLVDLEVDAVQGYAVTSPMPLAEFLADPVAHGRGWRG